MNEPKFKYIWYWKIKSPNRKGQLCRVLARGTMNSILIEFEDGCKYITSGNGIRKMPLFLITVTQISKNLHRPDNRIHNPSGKYPWTAQNADIALDEFHATIPIGCLEDFEIDIEQK